MSVASVKLDKLVTYPEQTGKIRSEESLEALLVSGGVAQIFMVFGALYVAVFGFDYSKSSNLPWAVLLIACAALAYVGLHKQLKKWKHQLRLYSTISQGLIVELKEGASDGRPWCVAVILGHNRLNELRRATHRIYSYDQARSLKVGQYLDLRGS